MQQDRFLDCVMNGMKFGRNVTVIPSERKLGCSLGIKKFPYPFDSIRIIEFHSIQNAWDRLITSKHNKCFTYFFLKKSFWKNFYSRNFFPRFFSRNFKNFFPKTIFQKFFPETFFKKFFPNFFFLESFSDKHFLETRRQLSTKNSIFRL